MHWWRRGWRVLRAAVLASDVEDGREAEPAAAGEVARRVRAPWRAGALPPFDPSPPDAVLPAAPATGWEAPLLFSVPLLHAPEPLLEALRDENLSLAGQCAALIKDRRGEDGRHGGCGSDRPGAFRPAFLDGLRVALVARCGDTGADLRARIAAGHALGALGDPRYERRVSPDGVEYLVPPMATIPAGTYVIGSDTNRDDEQPQHSWYLEAPFRMACFPVTNAEWALFTKAGGYDETRWWVSEEAARWRAGEGTEVGPRAGMLRRLMVVRREGVGRLQRVLGFAEETDLWHRFEDPATNEEFDAWLEREFPCGRLIEPRFWLDARLNGASQPVVGICRYEAEAYAAWLSHLSGQGFRLPTEREWEAAARGPTGRHYPWGPDFASERVNTLEGCVRTTTPVGVYPSGVTQGRGRAGGGLADLGGNVWEWTSSIYTPKGHEGDRVPPWNTTSEEEPDALSVVRGGSWRDDHDCSRASYRVSSRPGLRFYYLGSRLVCVSAARR